MKAQGLHPVTRHYAHLLGQVCLCRACSEPCFMRQRLPTVQGIVRTFVRVRSGGKLGRPWREGASQAQGRKVPAEAQRAE